METYACELKVVDGVLVSDLLIDQAVADGCYIYIGEEQVPTDVSPDVDYEFISLMAFIFIAVLLITFTFIYLTERK